MNDNEEFTPEVRKAFEEIFGEPWIYAKKLEPMIAYTCPTCGWTSSNPHDASQRYCGNCHTFEDAPKSLQDDLSRGAEPYWMQDIRIAQKRLESARRAV